MIQKLLLGLICICSVLMLEAKPVSKAEAQLVAENFYRTTAKANQLGSLQLAVVQTVYTRLYSESSGQMEDIPVYYVFNVNANDGFVMVTADDAAVPILGYATKGHFDPTIKATNFLKYVEGFKEQIVYIITNNVTATLDIIEEWKMLRRGEAPNHGRTPTTVNPLLGTIAWNQNGGGSTPWNALCPSGSVVGCVATAMAQIMKYHAHPTQGTGFHSYNHSTYGTLSVNFGSTTYNFAAMPNTTSSSESAKLSYHCGVAVDMMYSPSGSGAYSADAKDAFTDYFDYKSSTIQYLYRSNYSDNSWKQLLKADLDAGLPLYYAGTGGGGGHAFVCDGYDASDNFHYNWGWGGAYDGYFHIDALNPSGVGTGGGTGGFNSNHRVINGIEPNGGGGGGIPSADLELYSTMVLNPASPVAYGSNFSVTVDILNPISNSVAFSGEIAAALLDNNNNFVNFIETKSGISLNPNFYNTYTFNTAGNIPALPSPGSYNIVLYQKATGAANWTIVGNGSFVNSKPLVIQTNNSGGIDLYAALVPSVSPIVLGSAFTVTTNFVNNSATNFSGDFSIDLHDMTGAWVMTLDQQTYSLGAGNYYINNQVFNSAALSGLSPGTYQLAAWMLPAGGSWELIGNGAYSNPILVDVVEPALAADIYENNNTHGVAYNFAANFSGNTATISTPGANIHIGGDYDYYRVVLPPGYSYSIDAEVFDSYNTFGGIYDGDVLFSYDVGNGYSDSYDNSSPTINMPNGGTLTFQVAAYYQGQTGSYEFSATINRGAVNIQKITEEDALRIYPVPASQVLHLEFESLPQDLNQIEFYNALGQKVHTITGRQAQQQTQQLSIGDWTAGSYWMLLQSGDAITRKSFIVTH